MLIHWGPEDLDGGVIDPGFFGRNRYTTDLRTRGDKFSMYYIRDEDAEEIVIGSSEQEVRKVLLVHLYGEGTGASDALPTGFNRIHTGGNDDNSDCSPAQF